MNAARFLVALAAIVVAGTSLGALEASPAGPTCSRWSLVDRRTDREYWAVDGTPGDVWVVGAKEHPYERAPGTFTRAWTARWDGNRLRDVPNPVGVGKLSGVVARGPAEAWAVGSARGRPLVEHWNGSRWRIVAPPPVHTELWDVAVVGGRPWVLAGNNRIYELIQGSWRAQRGSPRAHELHGAPPHDAWTLLDDGTSNAASAAQRWNGSRWQLVAAPKPFIRIAPRTANDVWATLQWDSFRLAHLEEGEWRDVPTRGEPVAVEAVSSTEVLVLTRHGENDAATLERRRSGRWTLHPQPFLGLPYYEFRALGWNEVWLTGTDGVARFGCP